MLLTLVAERTLRVERRHVAVLALAAVLLWLNQLSFVFALDATTASTIGLLLGGSRSSPRSSESRSAGSA